MSTPTLNYANYDWADLVLAFQDRIKLTDSWRDTYRSGTGETLIELVAYALNVGLYYTERRATESFLPTARLLSSVKNLVALLNYQPKRKSSATGNLTFGITPSLTVTVFIPKYTECQSASGIKYLTNEEATIEKGQTSVTVSSIQGSLVRMEVAASGATNQEYLINSTAVENSANSANRTVRVVVDSVEWDVVDSFIDSDSSSKHYQILNDVEGTVTIKFGDNVNGLSPANGLKIDIQYIESVGLSGNVANTGMITTVNSTVYDENSASVTVTVTNPSSFLGGDDEEGIEEIRYEAPRVFRTGQRAVTRDDYNAILENYPGIANVNVWGETEEALAAGVPSMISMRGIARICILLQEWLWADTTFTNTLSEYLYTNYAELTTRYEFIDPVVLQVIPRLTMRVQQGHSLSNTQTLAEAAVTEQFILGDTTRLGEIVKYSVVLGAVGGTDGVSYANMVLEILRDLSPSYSSFCDYGATLEATDILPESARLFVDDVYVTTDVDGGFGAGTFNSAGGYTISGTIDYTGGGLMLDISPAPSLNIYVRYQQDGDGNITPTMRQIAKLYDVDFVSVNME